MTTQLLTAAQMRAIERRAIGGGRATAAELMERAGQGVVAAILAEWPDLADPGRQAPRAVVLCGPGNNGGDGFVVARLLAARGWAVEAYLYGDPERLPPDARRNHDLWAKLGPVIPLTGRGAPTFQCEVLVDALFGTGLTRRVEGLDSVFLSIHEAVNNMFRGPFSPGIDHLVAVDLPSGICADSGRALMDEGLMIAADLTVTFAARKLAHALAADLMGKVVVADIGIGGDYRPVEGELSAARLVTAPVRDLAKAGGNKFDHGHALVLSGPTGRGGAARLAARAALRVGAGLVTLACPEGAMAENAARLDAVMLRAMETGADLTRLLADRRIGALCLGPGLGLGARQAGLVAAALAAGRTTLLDADALTLVARDPALAGALHGGCVLTPHGGEFARLFPDLSARLAAPAVTGPAFSRVDAAREAAARAGCVVLLKGPDTVIAAPDGRCGIHAATGERAAPWLATAGAGDVLAGLIAGLLARGFPPFDAACTGAWLHVECARSFGPGLIAEDLPEELPRVLRGLGL